MGSTSAVDRLLAAASADLTSSPAGVDSLPPGRLLDELKGLLARKNGFYAFESALLVRPLGVTESAVHDLVAWNSGELWKESFGDIVKNITFFAEDIFGCQFGIAGESIVTFEPESGEVAHFADDIEGWVATLLADYQNLTGYPLAREWQITNGSLQPGVRLFPLLPFILGGEFAVSNLKEVDEVIGMRTYAGLYAATKNVADDSQVVLRIDQSPSAD